MFFEQTSQGIILRVRLQPNSSCCKISGIFTMPDGLEYLKINIISVPEKGKANQELISWLAKKINVAKSEISIISGELDRLKKLLITSKNSDIIANIEKLVS